MRFVSVSLLTLFWGSAVLAQAPVAAAHSQHSCTVVHTTASDGDRALGREDYAAALTFFRSEAEKTPSGDNTLGLVRALIGLDKVDEAIATADDEIKRYPKDAVAEIARAEAAFRAADFMGMARHADAAVVDDPCDGRAYDLIGNYYGLRAMYASEARALSAAHKLRPDDEFIRRDWIRTLFPKERQAELEKYLSGDASLSAKDRGEYDSEQQYLKARRPHECRVTSSTTATSIPFQPIYSSEVGREIVAYGLDVKFNDKRRRMEIDTGASGITITSSAASALHLTPEIALKIGGVGDKAEVESYITHIDKMQIGDVVFQDCLITVLRKSYLDVDGLIGMDVFGRWLVTLDYPANKLQLKELPARPGDPKKGDLSDDNAGDNDDNTPVHHDAIIPVGMEKWSPIVRIGHDILLPTTLNGGALHYMIADTGAQMTALSLPFARSGGKVSKDDRVRFTGLQGEVKQTWSIDNAFLTFGHLALPKQTFFAFDITRLSHNEGVELSGLLGIETLSRLTVSLDYRDNLISLAYDPMHDNMGVLH